MSKILVLGDTHGRPFWKEIIEKENPDKIIFLGDYVSTHEGISAKQQLNNLEEILTYKENNPDKVILLRGNHDTQHLGYYWAECSGWNGQVWSVMSQSEFKERFLKLTQWVYIDEELKTIFSHAGVSDVWMKNSEIDSVHDINSLEPSELFGFTPNYYGDCYGDSETQPPVWIRPQTLCKCNIEEWNQVVGHTPVQKGIYHTHNTIGQSEIWFCDALGVKQYLVIDNNEFQPKTFEQ